MKKCLQFILRSLLIILVFMMALILWVLIFTPLHLLSVITIWPIIIIRSVIKGSSVTSEIHNTCTIIVSNSKWISNQMPVSHQNFWDKRKTVMWVLQNNYVKGQPLPHYKSFLITLTYHSAMRAVFTGLLFKRIIL